MYGTVEALIELLSIPSVSGDKENCGKALDYMLERGEAFGFTCKKAVNNRVGIIEIGEGEETVGIMAHVDVADPGNRRLWQCDPFVPVVMNGNIIARGTLAGKGPAIAALFAMKDVWNTYYHRGKSYSKKIQLIIGTGLEHDLSDVRSYFADHRAPDYGFAPDGVFPICNVSMGTMNILFSFPIKKGIGCITDIKAGNCNQVVPEKCIITLDDDRKFAAVGKAVDSSSPERGVNAVFKMAAALDSIIGKDRLVLRDDVVFQVIRKLKYGFDEFYGQRAGMPRSTGSFKNEATGNNVYVPTRIYILKDRMYVNMNVRYSNDTDEKEIIEALEKYFEEDGMRIDNIDSAPGIFVSRNAPFVKALGDAYEYVTETRNDFTLAQGPSYAQLMDNMVIWGPVLPGREDNRRQPDESISVGELTLIESIYSKALHRMAFTEESFK